MDYSISQTTLEQVKLLSSFLRSKSGALVRALAFHVQCGPGFLGTQVFPSPQKPKLPTSISISYGRRRTTMWMCYLWIIVHLFMYLSVFSIFQNSILRKRLSFFSSRIVWVNSAGTMAIYGDAALITWINKIIIAGDRLLRMHDTSVASIRFIRWNVRKALALEQGRFDLRSEAWNSPALSSLWLLSVIKIISTGSESWHWWTSFLSIF